VEIKRRAIKSNQLKPGVTVVIVTYCRPKLLHAVLMQLYKQTELPTTIIVVDNDLNKSAKSVVDRFNFETKKFQVIYLSNNVNSLTVGRNLGVSQVSTNFTCLLDDDVVIPKNYLQRSTATMEKFPDAIGVQGMLIFERRSKFKNLISFMTGNFYLTNRTSRVRWSISTSYPKYNSGQTPYLCKWLSGTNQFYRTHIIKEIRWDENLIKYCDGEDLDHSFRVSESGLGSLYLIPNLLLKHLETSEARVTGYKNVLMREAYSYYLLNKLFSENRNAKVFYFWSRISTLIIRVIQIISSKFSKGSIETLNDYLRAFYVVVSNRKDIRKGNLEYINNKL